MPQARKKTIQKERKANSGGREPRNISEKKREEVRDGRESSLKAKAVLYGGKGGGEKFKGCQKDVKEKHN